MIKRQLRKGELTTKDMSVLRDTEFARTQATQNKGFIREYSLQHAVSLHWGDNFAEANRNLRPFQLRIDDKKYTLSWAELKEMDEAGFFRREAGNPKYYQLRYYDGPKFILDTDLNEEAERDMIVRFCVDGFELYIDWYEALKSGRFI